MLSLSYSCGAEMQEWPGGSSSDNGIANAHSTPAFADRSLDATPKAERALDLHSAAALIWDQRAGQLLYAKDADHVRPIASLTKLMAAMVVLDSGSALDQVTRIQTHDIDTLKRSSSRLRVGIELPRRELLKLALMASENRAAAALARSYPGGSSAFVAAMNRKARELGMLNSNFVDPTGLHPANVSNATELAIMANAAYQYPVIRQFTTTRSELIKYSVSKPGRRGLLFRNSNRLVSHSDWDIGLSKTGYTREAGRCLVLQTSIASKPVVIVLLNAYKKKSRLADANHIREWLSETLGDHAISGQAAASTAPTRMTGRNG